MIKLKKLQIIPKDASINEKRDIQFITTDVYVEKDQIIGVAMHIREKTITDSWEDITTQDYLEKEGIQLCTLLCKDGRNRLSNIIVDEQILKLIDENENNEQKSAWSEEGERIRKGLIQYFSTFTLDTFAGLEPKKILSWLEKQGEQKSADKVEPKFNFKVGQWIVATGKCVYLISKIDGFNVTLIDTNGDEHVFDASSLDDAHEWTIQDAKDGDVLISKNYMGEFPFIFKETKPSNIKTDMPNPLTVLGYCGIGGAGFVYPKNGGWGDTANCIYYPATKEQRDVLMKEMAEFVGYTR